MPTPRSGFAPIFPLLALGLLFGACNGESPGLAPPGRELLASQSQAESVASIAAAAPTTTANLFATPAAAMVALRSRHTASLLAGGQVLAAGGTDGAAPLAGAELFDPGTGAWTTTGSMAQARERQAAVVLATGQVLVTGGLGAGGALTGVELYDPQTAQWTARASMGQARAMHTITRLSSGKVLVLGGTDGAASLASGELYDPVADAWTAIAPLRQARARHTATLLAGERVLVVGGADDLGESLATTEILSPKGTWTSGAPLATARQRHTTTLLADGSTLVVGGAGAAGLLASAERYSPSLNLWVSAGAMAEARADHTALLTPLGHAVVAGGQGIAGPLATAEAYEPVPKPIDYRGTFSANPWFSVGSMSSARSEHTATLLGNGKALHTGGAALPSSELFDDAAGALGTACSAAGQCGSGSCVNGICCDSACSGECRQCNTAGTCVNYDGACAHGAITNNAAPAGNCLGGGGCTGIHIQNYCPTSYSPCNNSGWTPLGMGCTGYAKPNGILPVTTQCQLVPFTPAVLCNCIGGDSRSLAIADKLGQLCTTTAECGADVCVDGACVPACAGPPCWSLSPTHTFTDARVEHTATLLENGKLLFAGGRDVFSFMGGSNEVSLGRSEVFDPVTSTWTGTGLTAPHHGHTATLLPGGQVLLLGGGTTGSHANYFVLLPGARSEIYTPASNTWAPTGPLLTGRVYHTATLLPGGEVLVLGGTGKNGSFVDTPLTTAELYAPATGTSTLAAPMLRSRSHHTATLLPSGRVLVIGGSASAEVDLYDPATDTWSLAAPLPAPRSLHTATMLANGKVLVTGGDLGQPGTSALLYDPTADTWSPAASMATARAAHAATIVGNGDVIVAGGGGGAERYDPLTDTWSPLGSMLTAKRRGNTATLLPDGRLLVGFGLLTKDGIWGTANIETIWTTPPSLGQPCSTSASCQGTTCVDGVCCDTACDAGSCDACAVALGATADGICTTLTGSTCDDGNGCTTGDQCQAGVCTPGLPFVCPPPDACHELGVCVEPSSASQCSYAPSPDGTPCPGGACQAGLCTSIGSSSVASSSSASASSSAGAGGGSSASASAGAGGSAVASSSSSGSTTAGSGGMSPSTTTGAGGDSSSTTGAVATATATSSGTGGGPSSTVTTSSSSVGGDSIVASGGCSLQPEPPPVSKALWFTIGLLALAAHKRRSRQRTTPNT